MAHKRKGQLTLSPESWKHLRFTKREFWKRERRAAKTQCDDKTSRGRESEDKQAKGGRD